jgi:hypothetical protein
MLQKNTKILSPPLSNHDFRTENNQKLVFSDPLPPTSDYAIYEWSLCEQPLVVFKPGRRMNILLFYFSKYVIFEIVGLVGRYIYIYILKRPPNFAKSPP